MKNINKRSGPYLKYISRHKYLLLIPAFALIGAAGIFLTKAAVSTVSFEPEVGTLTSGATTVADSTASAGKYVSFGNTTNTTTFMPTAPYYATFYYPWYKNTATDGSYSYWQDNGNTPPNTWFSHYLPDINTNAFDPANELYSSNDYNTFKWQLSKMAEAKQEVAIASWFGQGTKQDTAIKKYLNDFMKRSDNPYPNLRWALYYECEGISTAGAPSCPSSTANPTTAQIAADLTYIKDNIANSPYVIRVNDRPVIFVYGETEDSNTLTRWHDANAQLGNYFYVVQKVFNGYATATPQPDSWHQYGPASGFGSHGSYSAYVSPGFWKDVSDPTDGAVRLARDLTRFQTDVTKMVNTNVTWKLVETWNEWGEGSSVEPGTQTMIDGSGKEVADPAGAQFGNAYIQALADRLPALEQGTGRVAFSSPALNVASNPIVKKLHQYYSITASYIRSLVNSSYRFVKAVFGTGTAKAQSVSSYMFGSGGDLGANSTTTSTLGKLDKSGSAYFLALGDLDYDETPTDEAWCAYVKANLPTLFSNPNYPFELVTGNHEEEGGPDGYILNHAACLPDQVNSQGYYPVQYYFDYPANNPLMRTIMISPNLKVGGTTYEYRNGTTGTAWLTNAIDQARAAGIPWVTVGMHKNCLSAGAKSCEISDDLINILVSKKVDIVLQGHEHNYQRTHQFAINGTTCTALSSTAYDPDCVVQRADPNTYIKGAGPFIVIDGIVGRSGTNYQINTSDPSYPYMVKAVADADSRGFVRWTVTKDRVDALFMNSGGTLTDNFAIVANTSQSDTVSPTVSVTSPVAGSSVSSASVPIAANASDNIGVSRVDFYVDGQLVNSDTTSPYGYNWDSTKVSNGAHQIQAKAYDVANNTGNSSIVSVTVANGCSVIPSTYGKVSTNVNTDATTYNIWVRMMAADSTNNAVGISVGSGCPILIGDSANISSTSWTWVNYANGSTANLAKVDTVSGSQALTIFGAEPNVKIDRVLLLASTCVPTAMGDNCSSSPDTTPPTTSITAPQANANVTGQVTISASATDANGITKVEFYIDNQLVGTDSTNPYSVIVNSSTLSNGDHTVTSKAYDISGNVATSNAVVVKVFNAAPSDLNADGYVDIFDLSILLSNWNTSNATSDINKDGIVDILDLSALAAAWMPKQ